MELDRALPLDSDLLVATVLASRLSVRGADVVCALCLVFRPMTTLRMLVLMMLGPMTLVLMKRRVFANPTPHRVTA